MHIFMKKGIKKEKITIPNKFFFSTPLHPSSVEPPPKEFRHYEYSGYKREAILIESS